MESLPQLIMRHPDITNLPALELPENLTLHTHEKGMDES